MNSDLSTLLRHLAGRGVCVVGDVMLDSYLHGESRGLCREAPVPTVTVRSVTECVGGAGNVAANVAALGGVPTLLGVIGDDDAGREVLAALRRRQVPADRIRWVPGRSTLRKRRVVVGSHLMLRLDDGTTDAISVARAVVIAEDLKVVSASVDTLVISDNDGGTLIPALRRLIAEERDRFRVVVVDAKRADRYADLAAVAVTPDYAEAVALLGLPALESRSQRQAQLADRGADLLAVTGARAAVVTLGRDGALLFQPDRPPFHARTPEWTDREVAGAGDVFTATMALALAADPDLVNATELATSVAAGAAVVAAAEPMSTAVCSLAVLSHRLAQSTKIEPTNSEPAKIMSVAQLSEWAAACRAAGRRVVFTNGCFDIIHEGHLMLLSQAKALGDVLVVAVNDDVSVRELKGPGRPVVALPGRLRLLAALSCVDHVVAFSGPSPVPVIESVRPDVFVKGGDYTLATLPESDALRRLGVPVRLLDYLPERSTSQIIDQVRRGAASQGGGDVPPDKVPTAVEIYPVLVRVINSTCGINRAELTPDRRVADLAIDSVFAGEIVIQTATELGMEADFLEILDDWSTLTLAELAAEFRRAVDDAQPGS